MQPQLSSDLDSPSLRIVSRHLLLSRFHVLLVLGMSELKDHHFRVQWNLQHLHVLRLPSQ